MTSCELSIKSTGDRVYSPLSSPSLKEDLRSSANKTVEHRIHQYPTPEASVASFSSFDYASRLKSVSHLCWEEGCNQRSFSRMADLRRHMKEVHGPLLLCMVSECSWGGTRRATRYIDHMRKIHGGVSETMLHGPPDLPKFATLTQPIGINRTKSHLKDASTHLYRFTSTSGSDTRLNVTSSNASTPMSDIISTADDGTSDVGTLDASTLDTGAPVITTQMSSSHIEISVLSVKEVSMSKLTRSNSGKADPKATSQLSSDDSASSGSVSPPIKTESCGDGEHSYEDSSEISSSDESLFENDLEESGKVILNNKIAFTRRQMVRRLMNRFWIIFKQATQGGSGQNEPSGSISGQGSAKFKPSSIESNSDRRNVKSRRRIDQAQDSDDDRMGEQPQADMALEPGDMSRLAPFACPYRKRDPQKYNINNWKDCALTPRENISRVKAHLYKHHLVHQCSRCKALFNNEEQLQAHLVCLQRCQLSPEKLVDGITAIIEKQLRSKKRSRQSQEDRWKGVYKMLFPGDEVPVPSPYFEPILEGVASSDDREQPRSEDYIRRELPRVFREALERAVNLETLPIAEHIQSQLHSMIQQCYETVLADYRASLTPSSTGNDSQAPTPQTEGLFPLLDDSMQAPPLPNNGHWWSTATNINPSWYANPIAAEPDMRFDSVPDTGYEYLSFDKSMGSHRQESTAPHRAEPFAIRPPITSPPYYFPTDSSTQLESTLSQSYEFLQYEDWQGVNHGVNIALPSDLNPLLSLNSIAADSSLLTSLPDFEDERGYNFDLYPQYNHKPSNPESDE